MECQSFTTQEEEHNSKEPVFFSCCKTSYTIDYLNSNPSFLSDIKIEKFPIPDDFNNYTNYSNAVFEWYKNVKLNFSRKVFPIPIGFSFYFPHILSRDECTELTKNDLQKILPLKGQNFLSLLSKVVNNTPIGDGDIFPKKVPIGSRKKEYLYRDFVRKEASFLSQLVLPKPNPNFYKNYADYVNAMEHWVSLTKDSLKVIPIDPQDFQTKFELRQQQPSQLSYSQIFSNSSMIFTSQNSQKHNISLKIDPDRFDCFLHNDLDHNQLWDKNILNRIKKKLYPIRSAYKNRFLRHDQVRQIPIDEPNESYQLPYDEPNENHQPKSSFVKDIINFGISKPIPNKKLLNCITQELNKNETFDINKAKTLIELYPSLTDISTRYNIFSFFFKCFNNIDFFVKEGYFQKDSSQILIFYRIFNEFSDFFSEIRFDIGKSVKLGNLISNEEFLEKLSLFINPSSNEQQTNQIDFPQVETAEVEHESPNNRISFLKHIAFLFLKRRFLLNVLKMNSNFKSNGLIISDHNNEFLKNLVLSLERAIQPITDDPTKRFQSEIQSMVNTSSDFLFDLIFIIFDSPFSSLFLCKFDPSFLLTILPFSYEFSDSFKRFVNRSICFPDFTRIFKEFELPKFAQYVEDNYTNESKSIFVNAPPIYTDFLSNIITSFISDGRIINSLLQLFDQVLLIPMDLMKNHHLRFIRSITTSIKKNQTPIKNEINVKLCDILGKLLKKMEQIDQNTNTFLWSFRILIFKYPNENFLKSNYLKIINFLKNAINVSSRNNKLQKQALLEEIVKFIRDLFLNHITFLNEIGYDTQDLDLDQIIKELSRISWQISLEILKMLMVINKKYSSTRNPLLLNQRNSRRIKLKDFLMTYIENPMQKCQISVDVRHYAQFLEVKNYFKENLLYKPQN